MQQDGPTRKARARIKSSDGRWYELKIEAAVFRPSVKELLSMPGPIAAMLDWPIADESACPEAER